MNLYLVRSLIDALHHLTDETDHLQDENRKLREVNLGLTKAPRDAAIEAEHQNEIKRQADHADQPAVTP